MLVRAIMPNYHARKAFRAAFEAPTDSHEVSVSRGDYVPNWLVKAYAKRWVESLDKKPAKEYRGLAFISAKIVREAGSKVFDSRTEYLGHADIWHPIIRKRGVTLPPEILKEYDDMLDKLVEGADYIEDPFPLSCLWRGVKITKLNGLAKVNKQ